MLPFANAATMNLHLAEISIQVAPGAHAAVVLGRRPWWCWTAQAGTNEAASWQLPDSLTLPHLPPYSPELNPVENVRARLRGNKLSNRVFDGCDTIVSACADACNSLIAAPERIVPIASLPGHRLK